MECWQDAVNFPAFILSVNIPEVDENQLACNADSNLPTAWTIYLYFTIYIIVSTEF